MESEPIAKDGNEDAVCMMGTSRECPIVIEDTHTSPIKITVNPRSYKYVYYR